MSQARLTSKGQLTVPKAIRDHLQLQAGDRVEFVVEPDGSVKVRPAVRELTSLKGCIAKPKRPVALEDMERAIRRRTHR